jgi:hypothetical protein
MRFGFYAIVDAPWSKAPGGWRNPGRFPHIRCIAKKRAQPSSSAPKAFFGLDAQILRGAHEQIRREVTRDTEISSFA